MSAFPAVRVGDHAEHGLLLEGRHGAGEVLLRAMARKITWFQAAEILGFSDRHLRRIRERYQEFGYDTLFDRCRGKPRPLPAKRLQILTRRFCALGFDPQGSTLSEKGDTLMAVLNGPHYGAFSVTRFAIRSRQLKRRLLLLSIGLTMPPLNLPIAPQ